MQRKIEGVILTYAKPTLREDGSIDMTPERVAIPEKNNARIATMVRKYLGQVYELSREPFTVMTKMSDSVYMSLCTIESDSFPSFINARTYADTDADTDSDTDADDDADADADA